MKISTNRDDLLKPLLQVGGVVERRQTLPILANVLISAKSDEIQFTATDLEVELKTRAKATSDQEMEFTVPARKLIDICKALPDGADIELEVSGDKTTLRSGRGRYTLGMLPAQDYPSIDPSTATHKITVSEGALRKVIEKTQFAMAQQDVRYYLNGMLFEFRNQLLRTVATDGHRLALCDISLDGQVELDTQIILPRKAVLELSRLLSDDDSPVQLEISNSHIRVNLRNTSFTSKLIDGRFPDYERVMPSGETQQLTADREVMRQALTRTAILSNEKYRGIRFQLSNGLVQLQAHNPEQDEAQEEVEVTYNGSEMTVGFNVGYLLDVLGTMGSKEFHMALVDSNSSTLVTPAEADGSRYVVMPMRL